MNRLRQKNYENENTETKYLNNKQKNPRILKVKNRPFVQYTWYNLLISYIFEPIKKQWVLLKIKL